MHAQVHGYFGIEDGEAATLVSTVAVTSSRVRTSSVLRVSTYTSAVWLDVAARCRHDRSSASAFVAATVEWMCDSFRGGVAVDVSVTLTEMRPRILRRALVTFLLVKVFKPSNGIMCRSDARISNAEVFPPCSTREFSALKFLPISNDK
jgi:hypothetical protein